MNEKIPNLKKWFNAIGDRNLELQERLYRLLVTIGLLGLLAGIINSIVIGEELATIAVLFVTFMLFAGVYYCSLRFRKIQAGAAIIGAILIYVVLPLIFLTSGGIYGGSPIWCLFGMVYVCLVVEGKVKYVFLVSSFIVDAACYYVMYAYSEMFMQHTLETAYADSLVSLLLVAVLVCGMIVFQNSIFRSENAVAKKQNKEIEELNRAQTRFFSSMSHEIRTPINTIIGLNEMILRENVSEEVAFNARNMQSASKMLLGLINDFLDMSKIESGKMDIVPVTYNVSDMLSDIVNTIWARTNEKGLEFHVDVDEAVPAQLIGDEVRIRQILINVLSNAVKYTQSGSVTFAIQCKEQETGNVQMVYSVTDTGIGIKQESIPHLFNAFRKVDESDNRHIKGTGLGLSIVKQLVDLMGGDIAVNSVYKKGTIFVITLPQKTVGDSRVEGFSFKTQRTLSSNEHYRQSFEAPDAHVLVVDDNDMNLVVAEGLLQDTKVQVDAVTSGGECLKKTLENHYDVIFMDHLMVGMDGIECLHAIREQADGQNQDTPVVVMTANAGGEEQALYRREGFDGYLPKPINSAQLTAELLKHLPKELVSTTNEEEQVGVVETPIIEYKKRLSVMVSADNVCDLPKDILKKHKIAIMPFRLRTENGEFLDGVEAEANGIVGYMGSRGKFVKSVPPDVSDYEEFFAEQLTKAQYIIHFTTARYASEGYANALEASKAFDSVIVVDSGHLSSGMGLIVLRAAEFAEAGQSVDEILDRINELKKITRTSFIVESTEYLARSGRISHRINEMCKVLMLHPVLVLRKSDIKVGAVRIGTKEHVRSKYIKSILNVMGTIDTRLLFITYAGLTNEELEDIKRQVQKKVKFQKIICHKASSAISTHCGPGTFGLLFMLNSGSKRR